MLIECIGLPGAGKTTVAHAIGQHMPLCQVRSGALRKLQYRCARVINAFGGSSRKGHPVVGELLRRHAPNTRRAAAQHFNLLWRARKADVYQRRNRVVVSDELLIQGIFTTFGPTAVPPADLRIGVEKLILSTYRPDRVCFLRIHPPKERWLAQLKTRRAGRSRFGRSSSQKAIRTLTNDRLYSDVILPVLIENGFRVVDLRTSQPCVLQELVASMAEELGGDTHESRARP